MTSKADLEYPKVPDSTKQGRDQGVDRPNDRYKSKANGYEYDDDIDNESTHSIPTLSESLTMSSTASLEEATSKARIAPTSVTDTPKPRAQKKELDLHGRQVSGHHRTPSVSRAIKRGSSAVKQGGDVSRIPLKTSKNERDIAQSILNGRGRSSSPAIERRKGERRAKPAAKEEGHSRSSAARNGIEQRSDATVSSSKSKQDHSQDRTPLAEKASLPSSSKNRKEFTTSATESKTKGKGRVTDLTSSSPEKPRPITLSSSRYHGIDEENEDSLVVAPSIARVEPSRGSSSKAPVSSLVLEEMYTQPVDRGKPSPVFRPRSHKKEERRINSSATRPRAKPAAKHIRPMECSALEKSSQTPRPTTPTSSPRKRLVEVVIESSPSSKKRASRPVKSEVHEEDRKSKRRSIDKEVKRSESPFEQTQVLWRKAAFRDSFDADRDVKMEESDSDSDGDVRLADIREIGLFAYHPMF